MLAAFAFGSLSGLRAVAIAVGLILLVSSAVRLLGRGRDAGKNAFPEEEQKRNNRIFGIVNAVTWVSVFLVFQILPRLGLGDLSVPAVVLIVGLHFFAMPPLFRHRANLVTGAVMVVCAILCPLHCLDRLGCEDPDLGVRSGRGRPPYWTGTRTGGLAAPLIFMTTG